MTITQRCDASCINNDRGMARRAKRHSSKRLRQLVKKEQKRIEDDLNTPLSDWEIRLADEERCQYEEIMMDLIYIDLEKDHFEDDYPWIPRDEYYPEDNNLYPYDPDFPYDEYLGWY